VRYLRIPLAAALAALVLPATAGAHAVHTVAPGDTLWSIAAANNLTTRTVAAYNGLPEDSAVLAGSAIKVPSVAEGAAALAGTAQAVPASTASTNAGTGGPAPLGAYTVRAGDTLSGLAAHSGVPVGQMAAANGLAPDAMIVEGTVLKLPTGAPAPAGAAQPEPAEHVVPQAAPNPSPGRLDGARVSSLAAEHGAPGSLAAAIGWQESGFNNAMVSSANARGVMQVLPGTWTWVQQNLAGDRALDPSSPDDNVRAGSMYLSHLLRETGGDPAMAAAGYYQGLASVRRIGMLPETRRYVDNVLALRSRFGG
jgi:soluble lytic murein transglycosylase-like protein